MNLPRTPSRPPTVLKTARATGPDALPPPGLAQHVAAAQQGPSVSLAAGRPHLVEIFENLDRQIAADAGAVLEGRGGKAAVGRAVGEFLCDIGEPRQRLGQKEAVVGDPGDAAESFGAIKKASPAEARARARPRSRAPSAGGDPQRRAAGGRAPTAARRLGEPRPMLGQMPDRAFAHDPAALGEIGERRVERRLGRLRRSWATKAGRVGPSASGCAAWNAMRAVTISVHRAANLRA